MDPNKDTGGEVSNATHVTWADCYRWWRALVASEEAMMESRQCDWRVAESKERVTWSNMADSEG